MAIDKWSDSLQLKQIIVKSGTDAGNIIDRYCEIIVFVVLYSGNQYINTLHIMYYIQYINLALSSQVDYFVLVELRIVPIYD